MHLARLDIASDVFGCSGPADSFESAKGCPFGGISVPLNLLHGRDDRANGPDELEGVLKNEEPRRLFFRPPQIVALQWLEEASLSSDTLPRGCNQCVWTILHPATDRDNLAILFAFATSFARWSDDLPLRSSHWVDNKTSRSTPNARI